MSNQELLIFEVGGQNFSVPLAVVEEVVPSSQITRIPNSPPFLLGLAAVRGKVMVVIDCALRYNLSLSLKSYFLVCHVRGNVTAITIDRPVVAGMVHLRELDEIELELLRSKGGVDAKFVKGGFELLELVDEQGQTRSTGTNFLCVDPDLFVSAEMASRVGEAV
jgi:chemotaxis signal transduction protein